jgi:hypothetical protein
VAFSKRDAQAQQHISKTNLNEVTAGIALKMHAAVAFAIACIPVF